MRTLITTLIVLMLAFAISTFLNSNPSGITGRTSTGCTCHGSLSAGNSAINISANPDIFSEGFTEGNTYQLTLNVTGGPIGTGGGFNLKASFGELTNPGANAKIAATEAIHSSANARSWTVDWVASSTATDSVVFNFTGNAVNGDGGTSGDDPTVLARKAAYKKSTSVIEKETVIAESFRLFQNCPNPFNSETKIGYQVDRPGLVELRIFNLLGRKVYETAQNHSGAGVYQFQWNGTTMLGNLAASGVYLYQVKFSNEIQGAKLILLK